MSIPALRQATYEDLLAVPNHLVAELIEGHIVTSPRPASRHALAASGLGGELYGPFQRGRGGPGGWIILDEPELHLGSNVLVPDLAGWKRERMPALPDVAAFELAPDWICEVLSPSTQAVDRADKVPLYARSQVLFVWLLDPLAQTLEAYRLEGTLYLLLGTWRGNTVVSVEPFESYQLDLGVLWER
ncbi:MAG TPA: Uma2 family endonuclease [Polyangiaceae bacterium]|nr:Uma2 family endonuclease [Polyangiaceae bacterium]